MPDPSGLLRPSSVLGGGFKALPGFGSRQPTDISGYMPDLRQVAASYQEQQDETPWWVKLLEIPDRLLGGQMLKGFLAGTGAPGAADNVVEGLRKNPAFQLLDILNPFGDPLTGQRTGFTDVRKALDLNFGQSNVDTGAANFAINLIGEILLDPSSFVLPFGAVAKGLKPGAGLAQAVMTGQRAMTVFSVPFVEGRYVFQPFKALDLKVAQGIEKWADFLNTNAVTKPILQAFSKTAVGIKGAARRAFVGQAVDEAAENATIKTLPLLQRLNKIAFENPEALKDGSMQKAIYAIREYGIEGVDELANLPDIVMGQGREVRQARHRFTRLIKEDQGFADLVKRAEEGDLTAAEMLYQDFPEVQLPKHLLDMHALPMRPGVEFKRPPSMLTMERNIQGVIAPGTPGSQGRAALEPGPWSPLQPREGHLYRSIQTSSDLWSPRMADPAGIRWEPKGRAADRGFDWAEGEGYLIEFSDPAPRSAPTHKEGRYLRGSSKAGRPTRIFYTPGGFPGAEDLAEMRKAFPEAEFVPYRMNSDEAIEVQDRVSGLSADTIQAGEQEVVDLFANLAKRGPDFQKRLVETANEFGSILDDAGLADVVSGFLNGMNELYMPRQLAPEVRKTVTEMWLGSVHRQFGGDARKFAEGFMKTRGPLDQLDTLTANHLIRELGTKFTGHRPLKEFAQSEAEGILAAEARILDPIMPALRKLDPEAAQFFNTNPFLTTAKRLEQSTRLHEKAFLNAALFGKDSPLVFKRQAIMEAEADLAQAAANPASRPDLVTPETGKLRRLLIVNENGNLLEQARYGGPVDVGSAWSHTMRDDMIGRKMIGRRAIRDELNDKLMKGEIQFDSAIEQLDTAAKLVDADDLTIAGHEIGKVRAYKRLMAQRKRLAKGAADPDTVLWYDERLDEMKAELLEEVDELKSARRDYLSAAKGASKEKTELLRDILSRRLTPEETREMIRLREFEKGRGVLPLDELRATDPDAYQKLLERYKDHEAVWVDADVYDGLLGKNGFIEKLRRPDMLAGRFGIKYLDGMQSWFKAWTLMPPWFVQTWMRDFVSGHILQGMAGDISPAARISAQKDAINMARSFKAGMRGDYTALDKVVIQRTLADGKVQTMTGREMFEVMAGKGAIGGSWWRDEMMMAGEEVAQSAGAEKGAWAKALTGTLPPVLGSKWNKGVAGNPFHNPIIRTGVSWRTFLDDEVRATGVIARWKSGQALPEAIQNSLALSYDPRKGLTSFERSVARRVLPFYGWTKFAVSKMTDLYLTKPGTITFWEKLHDSATKAALDTPESFEAVLPEFLKNNFGVPYRDTKDGPMYFALGNYIPVGEMTRLVTAIEDVFSGRATDTMSYAMERMDPFVRSSIEQVFNYSFYNQREIESFPGEHTEMFGITMPKRAANVIKSVRFLNELDRLNVVSFEDFSALRIAAGDAAPRGNQAGSRREAPWWERLMTGAFGPGPRGYLIDVKEETRFKSSELEREMSAAKGKLRRRLEEPGKPAKQADVETLQKVIADLMAEQARMEEVQKAYKVPLLRR